MGLESGATYPVGLNSAWPLDTDTRREGAAHIRETKLCLKNYAKLLNGAGAEKAALEYSHPIGSMYIGVPNSNSNPDNDIGGTWAYAGKIVNDPTGYGAGIAPFTELWVWQRTA